MNRFFTLLLAALCLTAVGQVPDYVPTEGMVGWWPFEGSYSNDYSGVIPVEVSEVAFSDGHFGVGQAAFFNDAAYIDLGDMPSPEEFTLTAWIRPSAGALDTWGNVYSDFVSGSGGLALLHSSNQPFTELYSHTTFGADGTCNTGLELEEESWQFVAMTRNTEGEVKIYWNMQLVGNCQSTTSPAQHSQSAFIGRAAHSNNEHWLGEIDDFGFWSRALNEVEMQSLYAYQPQMGCTDSDACNYDDNAEFDDGSCVSCEVLATACLEGTIWSAELGGCIVANPADINLDGCVQLNDLLDLLSAYGDCGAEEFVEAEWTSCGDLVGYQGYNYETVLIGEHCWFVENVRYLPEVSAPSIGSEQDGLAHAYVYEWYGENGDVDAAMATTYYNDYGVLYNFQAVETWSLCPSGWHVPSSIEFRDMDVALGLPIGDFNDVGWSGAGAAIGTALKVEYGWCCGGGGTNTSGFSAKGAGGRWGDGQSPQFSDIGAASRWWTSTSSGENAWHHDVASQNAGIYWKDDAPKSRGHSVRCIKDAE